MAEDPPAPGAVPSALDYATAELPARRRLWPLAAIVTLAIPLNAAHALFARPTTRRVVARFALLAVLWAALAAVFVRDPGRVLYWWFD